APNPTLYYSSKFVYMSKFTNIQYRTIPVPSRRACVTSLLQTYTRIYCVQYYYQVTSLFAAKFFQFVIFRILISCNTSSSLINVGLSTILFYYYPYVCMGDLLSSSSLA
ncbi:hypothetical protein L9F63_012230, partial [Diploptera punctata]